MSCIRQALLGALLVTSSLHVSGCSLIWGGKPSRSIDYVVRSGDTLSSIAKRFAVPQRELIELNRISNPNKLTVGQSLRIPYRGQGQAAPAAKKDVAPDSGSVKTIKLNAARRYVGALAWPVPESRLASRFGSRWMSFHEGLDLAAPIGTPIYSALDGVVVYSDSRIKGYGNMIVIRSPDLLHVYGHNNKNFVRAGDKVKRGQRIGEVGETGRVTGPHLHFETRIKDQKGRNVAIDPLVFFARQP